MHLCQKKTQLMYTYIAKSSVSHTCGMHTCGWTSPASHQCQPPCSRTSSYTTEYGSVWLSSGTNNRQVAEPSRTRDKCLKSGTPMLKIKAEHAVHIASVQALSCQHSREKGRRKEERERAWDTTQHAAI